MNRILLLCLLLIINILTHSQVKLNIPRNIEKAFNKNTRNYSGNPGSDYWQNTADYNINAVFNPSTLLLNGEETIVYTNNSPDTLNEIIFKLYPNLYKKGSVTLWKISPEDLNKGMEIENIQVEGKSTIAYSIEGTNMLLKILPLYPKQKLELKIIFNYTLNKGSHNRTGQIDPSSSFVAYFFPRITVYDDIDGWNRAQYIGTQEFYNDFSHFKVSITVPKDFIVWATGNLQNCNEVFNSKFCERIKLAETTNTPVVIIDSLDILEGNITKNNPQNTWMFDAENITDFVFATSNHYVWHAKSLVVDSITKRRTRTDAVYNPNHKDYYDVLHYNFETVKAMSFTFPKWPFPYPHITVFDGLDQMEYPMMVNDIHLERFDAITTTDHEVFHTMFPFYMGINETKYAWMDEGWATLGEWIISSIIDTTIADDYGMRRYDSLAGYEEDLPIKTPSTQLNGMSLFLNSYVKPALGYLYVKDYLGDELFLKSLHYYIANWQGKHPMPFDFFNCINTASGKNLNWIWKQWFFETGYPDLGIGKVKKKGNEYTVTIEKKGTKPVPIDLIISFDDNSKIKLHRNIGVWENGKKFTKLTFTSNKKVTKMTLGSLYIADVNKSDNIWEETTR